MKKVLMGLLMFMAAAAVVNAAVIDTVTIQGRSSEYVRDSWDSHATVDRSVYPVGNLIQQLAVYVIDGSGFDEKSGFHTTWTPMFDHSVPGTMWRTNIGDTAPWITFDLGGTHALSSIKVWNFNFAPDAGANLPGVDLLGVGVQEMDVILYDSAMEELAVFGPLAIDKAPGLSTVDFGQVIDIAALNSGTPVADVRYVGFNILSNHGGATGQVGLSEVRFYNDVIAPDVEAGDHQRVWLEDGSVDIVLDGMVDYDGAFTATWTGFLMGNTDPNLAPVIDDPNALTTIATLVAPGVYQFTLTAIGGGVQAADWLNVVAYEEGTDGLLAHWAFDEGAGAWAANTVVPDPNFSVAVDGTRVMWSTDAVSGNSLEVFGGTTATGIGQGGFMFTGSAGDLVREYLNDNIFNTFSVSLWFKASDPILPLDHAMTYRVGKGLIDTGASKVYMRGDRLKFIVTATNPYTTSEESVLTDWSGVGITPVNDDQWHFVTLTYDGYTAKLYLNSRLESQVVTYGGRLFETGNNMVIGGRNVGGNLMLPWSGWIDDVKIYNLPLTQADVAAAYAAGGRTPCLTLLAGDLDADCQVDLADFVMLAQDWLDCTNAVAADCFN